MAAMFEKEKDEIMAFLVSFQIKRV
jgi:hypothetical protein